MSGLLPLSSEHAKAGTYSYHGIGNPGSNRSSAYHFNRRRVARYNKFYRYRLRNYGKYYNHYPNYGNSYLGDAYNKQKEYAADDAEYDTGLRSDSIDTTDAYNVLGWLQLASGEYLDALNTFSTQAKNEPNDGTLRVGYALAAAETGDLHKAVWAMRSALRIDPESLNHLTLDASLQSIIRNLITQYTNDRHNTLAIVARDFMIASLYYLLGDDVSAGKSLPVVDTDSSTENLGHLIEQNRKYR
ncbi:MAG: hypothetical protein EP297_00060 [Gammaproteobacteria bacterium]|nr:MAG: hypothetical protein EP297_00060 [Gammaproteobacteria bacterium]